MMRYPGRKQQLTLTVLLLAALSARPGSAKKPPRTTLLDPISTGNANGPFAATLDVDGLLHLAYTASGEDGRQQLWYRHETQPGDWSEAEIVLDRAPDTVSVTAPRSGPVIGFNARGEGALALRNDHGWFAYTVAGPGEQPGTLALSVDSEIVHALVPITTTASAPVAIRRIVMAQGIMVESSAVPLPDSPDGRVVALEAVAAGDGWDHLLLVRDSPSGRIVRIGLDGKANAEWRTLWLTRLRESFAPFILMPVFGSVITGRLTSVNNHPGVLWTARPAEHVVMNWQVLRAGGQSGSESLIPDPVSVQKVALARRGDQVIVAAIVGDPPAAVLRVRWNSAGIWGEWQAPPGAERPQPLDPVDLVALIHPDGRARLVVQERWRNEGGGMRLVEWVALPGQYIVLGR